MDIDGFNLAWLGCAGERFPY